ncbi:MAG: hypothetical protein ACJAT7_002451 [Psychromonas sp.]
MDNCLPLASSWRLMMNTSLNRDLERAFSTLVHAHAGRTQGNKIGGMTACVILQKQNMRQCLNCYVSILIIKESSLSNH